MTAAGMTEEELKGLLARMIDDAVGYADDQITDERHENLKYYQGERFGNEIEGRSQVISRDVFDAVESVMPPLMRLFHGADEIVTFTPVGPEDEEAADQATDYVNYLYTVKNPGWRITHNFIKDGLIQKVGIVKHTWKEETRSEEQDFTGLTDDEVTLILADEGVEPVAQRRRLAMGNPVTGEPMLEVSDLTVRRTVTEGRICVENVPPDEFLIEREARDLESAGFVGHRVLVARSDLIAQGHDADLIMDLPADQEDAANSGDDDVRNRNTAAGDRFQVRDRSMERIAVVECYARLDWDGDGLGELRKIVVASGAEHVLSNEPIADLPFSIWSPIPVPHTVWGLALADVTRDVQRVKSHTLRGMIDGLDRAVNPRTEAVEGQANMADVLHDRPGGVIRVKQPGAVRELARPWNGQQAFPMLEYWDRIKEDRTGINDIALGIDGKALRQTTEMTANAAMQAAQARIEMYARAFADGYRAMFKALLRLAIRYQDKPQTVRLRGRWVQVDPRVWNAGMDANVDVGVGQGSKSERLAHLQAILGMQEKVLQAGGLGGMVTQGHIFNTLVQMIKAVGLPSADPYFSDPARMQQQAPPPPPSDPAELTAQAEMGKARIKAEVDLAEARARDDRERDRDEGRLVLDALKAGIDPTPILNLMRSPRGGRE